MGYDAVVLGPEYDVMRRAIAQQMRSLSFTNRYLAMTSRESMRRETRRGMPLSLRGYYICVVWAG
jgi:hypothetical protein